MKIMKRLLIVLAVMCLAGCASMSTPTVGFVSPPRPPSGQVVILAEHGCEMGNRYSHCDIAIKNIGVTDVRNIKFKLALHGDYEGKFVYTFGEIKYLPAQETIDHFSVSKPWDQGRIGYGTIVVDTFEIITE